jgi:hypothetical protein
MKTVRVRLTRKLAGVVNGVDISLIHTGDIIELPPRSAAMLVAEGWAEPANDPAPIFPIQTTPAAQA